MSTKARRRIALVLFCALLLVLLRLALNPLLGIILVRVFKEGTGCEVSVRTSHVYFFPIRGEVTGAVIRHPSEPPDHGFRADRLALTFPLGRALTGDIRLEHFVIEGASALSSGSETGFRNTLAFLFPPPPPVPPPPSRLEKLFSGAQFHVTDIAIHTPPRPGVHFKFEQEGVNIEAETVGLSFVEQNSDPKKPYDLAVSGKNATLDLPGLNRVTLGSLTAETIIGLGRLKVVSSTIDRDEYPQFHASMSGDFGLKEPHDLTMSYKLKSAIEFLRTIPQLSSHLPRGELAAEGTVKGLFRAPELDTALNIDFERVENRFVRAECMIDSLKTRLTFAHGTLTASDIEVDDVGSGGYFSMAVAPPFPFTAMFELAFDQSKDIIKRCYPAAGTRAPGEALPSDTEALSVLHAAFTDSTHAMVVTGTAAPQSVAATVRSELFTENFEAKSRFAMEATVREGTVEVKLNEEGTTPRIDAAGAERRAEESASSTPVVWKQAGHVAAHLIYDSVKARITALDLQVNQYPARRLLMRIGAFLSRSTVDRFNRLAADETTLDASLSVQGPVQPLSLDGTGMLTVSGLHLLGMQDVQLEVPVQLQGGAWVVETAQLETAAGRVTGKARSNASGQVTGELRTDGIRLWDIPATQSIPQSMVGLLKGEMGFELGSGGPLFKGNLDILGPPSAGEEVLLKVSAQGGESKSAIDINGADGKLTGQVTIDRAKGLVANLQANNVVLSAAGLPADSSTVTGSFAYTAPPSNLGGGSGTLKLSDLRLNRQQHRIRNAGPLVFDIRNGDLHFSSVTLEVADQHLKISGSVSPKTGWNTSLSGSWELGTVLPQVNAVESITGTIRGDITVTGPFAEPRPSGPVSVENFGLSMLVGDNIIGFSNGKFVAQFDGDGITAPDISVRLGSGTVRGRAHALHLFSPVDRDVQVQLGFEDIALAPMEHLSFVASGELDFMQLGSSTPRLTGNIDVQRAEYENQVKLARLIRGLTDFFTGRSVARRRSARSASTAGDAVALDINIRGDRNLIIDTNVVQTELGMNLHLVGSVGNPLIDGKVTAIEGVFGLGANEFDLVSGELLFASALGTLEPRVSIVGETTVRQRAGDEYLVQLIVRGPLSAADVRFHSDSNLSQEQIVALFGLGAEFDDLNWITDARQRSLAELLNPTSNLSIEQRLRGLTGFSDIKVDSALSPETGEFVPRLVAKRPVVGDVGLTLESELAGNQVSTASVDYLLTQYLTVFSGWRSTAANRTASTGSGSGSYEVGVRYHRTFPGLKLIPRDLSEEADD